MSYQKVLIKYGGNAMISNPLKEQIATQIKKLLDHGIQVVLVHGGGPFIDSALQKAGIKSEFFEGQRITSLEALPVIERTLKGEVNGALVNIFNKTGMKAVGLSGKDGKLVTAQKISADLGYVGEVQQVNTHFLDLLLTNHYLPMVTCLGSDDEGNDYNINGDTFAGKIASALQVDAYIVLTDVDGLYQRYPDPASLITQLTLADLPSHYHHTITGGMLPKILSCENALSSGVKKTVILNGTKPEQISNYLLENKIIGTTITQH